MNTIRVMLVLFIVSVKGFSMDKRFNEQKRISNDSLPLQIINVQVIDSNRLDILFSDIPEQNTAENIHHYFVNNNIGEPTYAMVDLSNPAKVHILFSNNFPERTNLLIRINGITNVEGTSVIDTAIAFLIYTPLKYDIVIDEIMADPSPSVSLPESEWIELRNVSPFEINLSGWRIAKSNTISGPMAAYVLKPDSAIIVCSTGSVSSLANFCSALSVTSFPALTNTGDLLVLKSPQGKTIHAVNYSDQWYQNEFKKQGGWSLEMKDLNNPCTGVENWFASTNVIGGTPGKINSIDALNVDNISPSLLRAYATDSLHLTLYFNEPLDSGEAVNINHYFISDNIENPETVVASAPLFQKVNLTLNKPLAKNKTYFITATGIKDCVSNEIGIYNHTRVGLSENSDSLDVIINEILFNPPSDGVDFVELYNRSEKIINLRNLFLANLNTSGLVDNITPASEEDYLLFPADYIVLTSDPIIIKRKYISENPDCILYTDNFPPYNDDEGNVIVLNQYGNFIDKVAYKDDWHFKLINDVEGVSLERINFNNASQDPNNWHSASTTVGYATPAYKNSQMVSATSLNGNIVIVPKTISPNNDGRDDVANIYYNFSEPGYVANIDIFDDAGRLVKSLKRNALCGTKGSFVWDGLDNNNRKLVSGIYIVLTDLYNLKGERKKFKNALVLAK